MRELPLLAGVRCEVEGPHPLPLRILKVHSRFFSSLSRKGVEGRPSARHVLVHVRAHIHVCA